MSIKIKSSSLRVYDTEGDYITLDMLSESEGGGDISPEVLSGINNKIQNLIVTDGNITSDTKLFINKNNPVDVKLAYQSDLDNLNNKVNKFIVVDGDTDESTRIEFKPESETVELATVEELNDSVGRISNSNLLDNWYFGNPVNQRGGISYGNEYSIDRWIVQRDGSNSRVWVDDGYITMVRASDATYLNLRQNIVPMKFHEKCILSFLVDDPSCVSKIFAKVGDAEYSTDNPTDKVITLALNDIPSYVGIQCGANSALVVRACKLEIGNKQTLAHQENGQWILNEIPDYGEQLARCQRYFYKFDGTFRLMIIAHNSTEARGLIIFPQTMIDVPVYGDVVSQTGTITGSNMYADHAWFYGFANAPIGFSGVSFYIAGFGG